MTKEEYEILLKSDYWKGFSYSLIKERNFTCEDCGRRFYNQRNKLQVHHLVYRDINPWSYKPEEMVVLCEECHKKRHNILSGATLKKVFLSSEDLQTNNNFTYPSDSRNVRESHVRKETDRWGERPDYRWEPERRFKKKYVLYGMFLFVVIFVGVNKMIRTHTDVEKENVDVPIIPASKNVKDEMVVPEALDVPKGEMKEGVKRDDIRSKKDEGNRDENKDLKVPEATLKETHEQTGVNNKPARELSTIELLERRNHANAVERAKRAGVSTEGSTIDILERINHANAVERAKRAGVSTEGSTIDILERINHANAVERAKRVGVSTEGSTIDILERINHANAVERAKRVGVSTEGSTVDILERINRKQLEDREY